MTPLGRLFDTLKTSPMPATALAAVLAGDWRLLFPLRIGQGHAIRAAILASPQPDPAAAAAFGCGDAALAPDWLYKDFHVDTAPPHAGADHAVGRLRRGQAAQAVALLALPLPQAHHLLGLWFEISALAGRVIGAPQVRTGGMIERPTLAFDAPLVAGGGPAEVVDEPSLREALAAALAQGVPSLEAHRTGMAGSLEALLSGTLAPDAPAFSTALSLVRLHTDDLGDRLADLLSGRSPFDTAGGRSVESILAGLAALRPVFSEATAFRGHLDKGLASPSRARRFVSYGLLLREGALAADAHPDDLAPWVRG